MLKSNTLAERLGQLEYLKTRIEGCLASGSEISYVIPAFPFKSPNKNQVISVCQADGAEIHALASLARLLDEKTRIYIATDSWIFYDLYDFQRNESRIKVEKESISQYAKGLADALAHIGKSISGATERIRVVAERELDGFCNINGNFAAYLDAETEKRKPSFKPNRYKRHQLLGTRKTMARIFQPILSQMENGECAKLLDERSEKAIIRTDLHQECIQKTFPEAIRISVHKHYGFEKIGVFLVGQSNIAPWNGVLFERKDGTMSLECRENAEAMGKLSPSKLTESLSRSKYLEN